MKDNKSEGALSWASENSPTYCEAIESLYSWSSNYQDFRPFRMFLDLVGHSSENLGEPLADWKDPSESMGFVELGKLGDALSEWANRPADCETFVSELLNVESEFGL
jgi:hypothetical protein